MQVEIRGTDWHEQLVSSFMLARNNLISNKDLHCKMELVRGLSKANENSHINFHNFTIFAIVA